jgi:hypothetical protein
MRRALNLTQVISEKTANHFKSPNDGSDMKQKPIHPAPVLRHSYFPEKVGEIKNCIPIRNKGLAQHNATSQGVLNRK